MSKTIQIKVSDTINVWNVLSDLIELNDNPFKGNARRLLFKLQPELKFIQECDKKDLEAIADKSIDLGEKIPAPQHFADEYTPIIEKLCSAVPQKESQISKLVKRLSEKEEQS